MSSYSSQILLDNPLAYWRLDDAMPGAADTAANVKWTYGQGASVGLSPVVSDGGRSVSGVGNNPIATYPFTPAIKTMEAWIAMPTGTAKDSIISLGNGNNGFGFGIGSGNWQTLGTNIIILIGNVSWIDTGYSLSAGVHHIVLTVSGGTGILYVDGTQRWTGTANPQTATGGIGVGGVYGGTSGLSSSVKIDNVALYGSVLTSTQASTHYAANGSSYSTAVLADSPLHYLKFDETSLYDFTNSTTSDSMGGTAWAFGSGVTKGKTGIVADGGTAVSGTGGGPIASIGQTPNIASLEAWIKMPAGTAKECIASTGNGGNGFGFGIGSGNWQTLGSKLIVLMGGVSWIDTNVTIPQGVHHIVLTVSAGTAIAYIDGSQVWTSGVSSVAATGGMAVGGVFGANTGLSSTVDVDNVAFYSTALSSARVSAHYAANGSSYSTAVLADSPTNYLKFDDAVLPAPTWADGASNGHSLTASSGLAATNPAINTMMGGTSMLFDGQAYAYASNPTWATSLNALSIDCWIKTSASGAATIISLDDASLGTGSATRVFTFGLSSSAFGVELFLSSGYVAQQSAATVTDGAWHHLACAWDGSTLKLYVDGVQTNSAAATGTLHAGSGNNLLVGANYLSGVVSRKYAGFLDELALYPTGLSASRVAAHYNAGVNPVGNISNRMLWVRAKDLGAGGSSVSSWTDQSGQSHNGTAAGTAPTVATSSTPIGGKSVLFGGAGHIDFGNVMNLISYTFTASSSYPGWPVSNLGDGPSTANGNSWSASSPSPGWIQVQTGVSTVVSGYAMRSRADAPGSVPKAWTFKGSNDGSTWTSLDTQSGVTFTSGERKTFSFANSTSYTYYRMDITDTGSANAWPSFSEFELLDSTATSLNAPPGEIWAVIKSSSAAARNGLWAFNNRASQFAHSFYPYSDGYVYDGFGVYTSAQQFSNAAYAVTNWHIYRVAMDGTNQTTYIDGVQVKSTGLTTTVATNWGTQAVIGRTYYSSTSTDTFSGNIAEVIVRKGVSTEDEAAAISGYLINEHFTTSVGTAQLQEVYIDAMSIPASTPRSLHEVYVDATVIPLATPRALHELYVDVLFKQAAARYVGWGVRR